MNWNQVPMNLPQHPTTKAKSLTVHVKRAAIKAVFVFAAISCTLMYADSPAMNGSDPTPLDRPNVVFKWKP